MGTALLVAEDERAGAEDRLVRHAEALALVVALLLLELGKRVQLLLVLRGVAALHVARLLPLQAAPAADTTQRNQLGNTPKSAGAQPLGSTSRITRMTIEIKLFPLRLVSCRRTGIYGAVTHTVSRDGGVFTPSPFDLCKGMRCRAGRFN